MEKDLFEKAPPAGKGLIGRVIEPLGKALDDKGLLAFSESLASENASRLAAMQRAEKNIKDLLNELTLTYHQLRQSSIDEEMFDVIFGSEELKKKRV